MGATIVEIDDEKEGDQLPAEGLVDQGTPADEAAELPDKYRGKSLKEIVQMHQEAEKALGRQGHELGELRKLADAAILKSLAVDNQAKGGSPSEKEDEQVDFFADPQAAVKKMIESDPRIKSAQDAAEMVRRQTAQRDLLAKHPDAMELAQSDEFQEWVAGSKVRTALYAKADQEFDMDAAEELLTTFKAIKGSKPAADAKPAALKSDAKAGKVLPRPVSGGSDTVEGGRKPVYRRADIIKLSQTDPERYWAMQEEIMAAYQEGRVR